MPTFLTFPIFVYVSRVIFKKQIFTDTLPLKIKTIRPVRPHRSCWCIPPPPPPQSAFSSSQQRLASSFSDGRRSESPTKPSLFPVSPPCFLLSSSILLLISSSETMGMKKMQRRRCPDSRWKVKEAVWWRMRRSGRRNRAEGWSREAGRAFQLLGTAKRTSNWSLRCV